MTARANAEESLLLLKAAVEQSAESSIEVTMAAVATAQAQAIISIALALTEREPMAVEFVGYGGTA